MRRRRILLAGDPFRPLRHRSGPRVSSADVMALYRIELAELLAWAREDAWTRRPSLDGPRWDLAQVQASYERRRVDTRWTRRQDPA